MKVTNWRRKLAATLVAGGLMSPAAAYAQSLNTNLVVNGTFETVDLNTFGEYAGPLILNWTGPNLYAYSHNGSTSAGSGTINPFTNDAFPAVVPDYADGPTDPPGAGNWYFTANNTGQVGGPNDPTFTSVNDPNTYYQDINVSAGAVAAAIAEGKGRADLSAYMSSYLNDTDVAHVRVEFRDNLGASLGFAQIDDSDPGPDNVWNLNTGNGAIPVGTSTLRVSLFGTRTAGGGGADGYMDNVEVKVAQTVNPQFLTLEINTFDGKAAIKNQTGQAIPIDYYEIASANGLLKTTWSSLQDQNRPDFPAGNGSGNGWEELGGVSTNLVGDQKLVGSNFVSASGPDINLGTLLTLGGTNDIKFRYAVPPEIAPDSDFNGNTRSDGSDFLIWQRNFGLGAGATQATGSADGDEDVDSADYAIWRSEFGESSFEGPGVLVTGIVKYVTTGPVVGVPEPGCVVLVGMGLGALAFGRSRRRNLV